MKRAHMHVALKRATTIPLERPPYGRYCLSRNSSLLYEEWRRHRNITRDQHTHSELIDFVRCSNWGNIAFLPIEGPLTGRQWLFNSALGNWTWVHINPFVIRSSTIVEYVEAHE